jgi:hypothetical protein
MTQRTQLRILAATTAAVNLLLIACSAPAPTPTIAPSATLEPTRTPSPTQTPTDIPPTITPSPAPTATRTRAPAPTRAPATPAPISAPLTPLAWDARLDALGITYIPAPVQPGQPFWRLIRADFWDEKERQGKHHIFVNVLDENGARIIGQKVIVEWPDERLPLITEDKPAPEYSANFPLDVNHYPPWGTLGAFTVWVDGLPSDKVAGMGLPPKNKFVVYLLTFQRTIGGR